MAGNNRKSKDQAAGDVETRRGRPAGSPNKEYLPAVEIPAVCPTCNGAELTAVPGAKPIRREIAGKLPSGLEYEAVEWQRSQCRCGQHVTVRKYFPKK